MVLSEYLSIDLNNKVQSIILIEHSERSLARAELHAKLFFPSTEIITINKFIDDIEVEDLPSSISQNKLHIFSNILDIESISIAKLCKTVRRTITAYDEFICVGPKLNINRLD